MAIRIQMTGAKELEDTIIGIAREAKLAVRRGTRDLATEWLQEILPGVPVDKGDLVGSAKIRVMIRMVAGKENVGASIVFGGQAAPHAILVHETHKEKSKFLEAPLREKASGAAEQLKEKIDLRRIAMEAK